MLTNITDIILTFFKKYPSSNYKKGDKLFYPGEIIDKAFFVKSGFVREYTISKKGVELTLHLYKANSFFPMTGIIADIENRYFYEVFTDSTLISIPKYDLLNFFHSHPPVLFYLTSKILQGLDKMLIRIEGFVYNNSYQRVVSTLLFFHRHFEKEIDGKISFNRKFTRNDIAAIAGVSRETVSRELKKLKVKKLIEFENTDFYLNVEKLEEELK